MKHGDLAIAMTALLRLALRWGTGVTDSSEAKESES